MIELALHLSNPALLSRLPEFLAAPPATWQEGRDTISLERKAWRQLVARLPSPAPALTRLYLGNEFCPYLAWSSSELAAGVAAATESGLSATLVFGPQTEGSIDASLSAVAALSDTPGLEVVVNDWGLLQALADGPAALAAGRMLYKAKRNPRLSRETVPQGLSPHAAEPQAVLESQLEQWSLLPSDAPWLASLLERLHVQRAEIELVPQGALVDDNRALPLSLYLPWTYVTGGGSCPVARLSEVAGEVRCARRCRSTWIDVRYPGRTWPLPQIGQTVFSSMVSVLGSYCNQKRIDRWVLEPLVPM